MYKGFVKHPHIYRKNTKMCICVYACVYNIPRGMAKCPIKVFQKAFSLFLYRGFMKPQGVLQSPISIGAL